MSLPDNLDKDVQYKNTCSCATDGNNITSIVYLKCPDTEVSIHVHMLGYSINLYVF